MTVITTLGSPAICAVILLSLGCYSYFKKLNRLSYITLTSLLLLPLAIFLKELFRRIRPDTVYVQNMVFQSYSFPSGHAYSSFLVYGLLIFLVLRHMRSANKWPIIAGLTAFILMIGISRVYLGAHFPSDVIGGWLVAALVLFLIAKLQPQDVKVSKR